MVLPNDVNSASAVGTYSRLRRHILIYGTAQLLLCLLQTTLFARFRILGITPDLCLLLTLGAAMHEGSECGGAVGLFCGFLECALGGIGSSALPILFLILGYGVGQLSGRTLPRTFPSYLILAASLCVLRPAVTLAAIGLAAQTEAFELPVILRGTLLPEMLVNFLFSLPMYPLIRKLHSAAQKKV